jgi:ABC-type glycerol-3-phosphate transport system substrate-binding protein
MTLSALGIFSAAGAGGGPQAYELISTAFGTGASGVITFSSIPSTYRHLQIRYTAINTSTATQINITMNGITSGVYARHSLLGNGSTVGSNSAASQTAIQLPDAMTNSTTSTAVNGGIVDVLDYTSTTKNKTLRAFYGMAYNINRVYLSSGLYNQTTPVSSITLTASNGNFTTLSRFSLYGIRG